MALEQIKRKADYINVVSREYKDNDESIPWFPKNIKDLDRFANQVKKQNFHFSQLICVR